MAINIGDAVLTISADIKDLNTKLGEVKKQVNDSVGNIMNESRKIGVAFTLVGGAIVAGFTLAAHAAAQEEAGVQRLSIALKNVGIEYDAVKDSLEGVIAATAEKTAVSDGEQRESIAGLVAITGDYQKSLNLLPLALDLAAGKGMDLASAAQVVGRVAEGNTAILTRYGIQIREGATATEALGMLQQKYAGQAEAYGRTTAGQFTIIKNAIDDLVEAIGVSLLPVVKSLIAIVKPMVDGLKTWIEQNQDTANAILLVVGNIALFLVTAGPLLIMLPGLVVALKVLGVVIAGIGLSVGVLLPLLGALVIAFSILAYGLIKLAGIWALNERLTTLNKQAVEEYNKLLAGQANNYKSVLEEQIKAKESQEELNEEDRKWIAQAKERLTLLNKLDTAINLQTLRIDAQILANDRFRKSNEATINEQYGVLDAKERSFTVSLMDQARKRNQNLKVAVDDEITIRQKAHDTAMSNLDKEYANTLRIFDAETGFRIAGIQIAIDAIDKQTETENRAEDEKERVTRTAELKLAVDTAKTSKGKAAATKALSDYTTQVERERLLLSREDQKDALRDSIDAIVRNREAAREEVVKALDKQLVIDQRHQEKLLKSDLETLNTKKDNLDKELKQELILIDDNRIKALEIEGLIWTNPEGTGKNDLLLKEKETIITQNLWILKGAKNLVDDINAETARLKDRTVTITEVRSSVSTGGGTFIPPIGISAPAPVAPVAVGVPGTPIGTPGTYETFQHGGVIPEPTLLTSLRTLRPYAIAGEAGPERVSPMESLRVMITGNNFYVRQESDIDRIGDSIVRKIRLTHGLKI